MMATEASALPLQGRPQRSRAARLRTWARRDPVIVLAIVTVLLLACVAAVPQVFAKHDPIEISPLERMQPVSANHPFGTDHLGRDILSRVVYATRTTLGSALAVVITAAFVGVNIGAIAGYRGGLFDEIMMRTVDLFMAFPLLVLAMVIVASLGPGLVNAMLALIVVWWAQYARLTRGLVMQARDREFVTASRALGRSGIGLLYRHILPNCFSPLLVKGTLDIAVAVLTTASLSFLGLGVQPPDPDWGAMVSAGREFIREAWWYTTFPGLAIFITVMSFNLLGDALRDLLDPRLRT